MRTILNMKPGPGGRRLQKELEAKGDRVRILELKTVEIQVPAGFYL